MDFRVRGAAGARRRRLRRGTETDNGGHVIDERIDPESHFDCYTALPCGPDCPTHTAPARRSVPDCDPTAVFTAAECCGAPQLCGGPHGTAEDPGCYRPRTDAPADCCTVTPCQCPGAGILFPRHP